MFVALRNAHFGEIPDDKRSRMRTSAMGRDQPVMAGRNRPKLVVSVGIYAFYTLRI
jgi:hypothetical protein